MYKKRESYRDLIHAKDHLMEAEDSVDMDDVKMNIEMALGLIFGMIKRSEQKVRREDG